MKKRYLNTIRLLLGLFILFILITKVGVTNIYDTFKSMDWRLYLLYLVIVVSSNFILSMVNLSILLSKIKKIKLTTLLNYYMISWSLGLFAPGKVGEFSIVYFLKKEGIDIGKGTAISMIDKLMTIIILAIFSIIGFFSFFELYDAIIISFIVVAVIVSIPAILTNRYFKKILNIKIINKFTKKFSGFSKTIKMYLREHKKILFANFIITSVKWIVNGIAFSILFLAFGKNVNIFTILLVNSITSMIGLIPLTINGIGIKEAISIFLYTKVGIDPTTTLSLSIITSATNYSIALLITLFSKLKLQQNKQRIKVENDV